LVRAAAELNTFIVLPSADITADVKKYMSNVIPLISSEEIDKHQGLIKNARVVAFEYHEKMPSTLPALKEKIKKISKALTIIRVPATKAVENIVSGLAHHGAEIIHVVADYRCMEIGGPADEKLRLGKDIIRAVHLKLVEERIRDEVTIIFSGGIAMAEHVPKAMICGADLTAIDLPLMIALGARLYEEPQKIIVLPEGLGKITSRIISQRVINLMGAWHSQLLEVMGAMGIREARRLRGETGRAIFFEEIDNDTFGKIFKQRETANV
jgi:hypothetical protein